MESYLTVQDINMNKPNGGIVLEDFTCGEGFYKVHLDYLNKKQVEEVEEMVRMWNNEPKASNENIRACIGMCLTDADEQRFKNHNTNLRDCLAWLEKQKQGEQKFDIPEKSIKEDSAVTSRMEYIHENLKPMAEFIIDYAHWNLHKDEHNQPVAEVPLFRVLDALLLNGKPYQSM